MLIRVSDDEVYKVTGTGRNGDGDYFIFLEGDLLPRWIGKPTEQNGLHTWFEGMEYPIEREFGEDWP